jgi:hypothetical protein
VQHVLHTVYHRWQVGLYGCNTASLSVFAYSNDNHEGPAERERALPLAEFEPGNLAGALTFRSALLSAHEAMRLIIRFLQAQCKFIA